MGKDRNVLLISVSVFLSYLPEAGQYSCFFVYLRLVSHQVDAQYIQYTSWLTAGKSNYVFMEEVFIITNISTHAADIDNLLLKFFNDFIQMPYEKCWFVSGTSTIVMLFVVLFAILLSEEE